MSKIKVLEKVSETPLDEKTGLIFNSENIENKAENTYSAEIVDKIVEEYSGVEEGTIVEWDGDTIPEGYEEVSNPNSYSQTTKTSAASGESFMSVTIPSSGIYKISAFYRGYYTYNSLDTINAVFTSAKGVNLYNSRIANIPSDGSTIRFANTVFVVATLEAGDEISFSLATGTQKGMNIADSSFLVAEKIG